LLEKALEAKTKGVNILIHGPPGGGKTELAKTLAKILNATMYAIGEDLDDTADPDAKTCKIRQAQLLRARALLKDATNTILMVDEIEDFLLKGTDSSKAADTDSKIQTNRLFENNDIPTICIANDPDKFHPAVRQRFTYSIYVDYPPVLVRQRMWRRQCGMQKYDMPPEETIELARKYDVSPRTIAKAIQAAALTGQGRKAIERSLRADSRLVYGSRDATEADDRVPEGYRSSLVLPPGDILGKLVKDEAPARPFSLLVRGPEGSGAASFLRYAAEQASMNMFECSMKAIAVPSQNATPEGKVRQAFAEASGARQFLMIRDLEHLSENPASSAAEWDNGLTRAFRKAARAHKLPFAEIASPGIDLPEIVTNVFSDGLVISPMTAEQADAAYRQFFGRHAPEALLALSNLYIGDFAEAADYMKRVDPAKVDDAAIVKWIGRGAALRGGTQGMGFGL
jgi:hypothetical protein